MARLKTKVARSAVTGKFVTKKHAAKHPKTTVVETVVRPTRRPRSKKR